MIKFPKIKQYRQIVKILSDKERFTGLDENGDPTFDSNKELPTIEFTGRCKLHGTNAAVILDTKDRVLITQSRERIITPIEDNAGFSAWVNKKGYKLWEDLLGNMDIREIHKRYIVIYGEWCGGNIQKTVALTELPKMFVVFGLIHKSDYSVEENEQVEWCDFTKVKENPDELIYNIGRIPSFRVDVNLNIPKTSIAQMVEITDKVEECCPFAKSLGIEGIGEGVVYTEGYNYDYAFKVKGEKHSISKVKKLPSVNVEAVSGARAFAHKHAHEDRLEQAWGIVCEPPEGKGMEMLGDFIQWVVNDILEEELDEAVENEIDIKLIKKNVPQICVPWFKRKLFS